MSIIQTATNIKFLKDEKYTELFSNVLIFMKSPDYTFLFSSISNLRIGNVSTIKGQVKVDYFDIIMSDGNAVLQIFFNKLEEANGIIMT